MTNESHNKSLIINLSDKYGQQTWFRALIQAIPYAGGSLDTLISAKGQKWREERISYYISEFSKDIDSLNDKFEKIMSEEFFDLFRSHIENVDKTRSKSKIKRFANLLLNQIERQANWDEPEIATRILNALTDSHVMILKSICSAPICIKPFEGLRVSIIEPITTKDYQPTPEFHILNEKFPKIPKYQLRLLVTELMSWGLVQDEGIGRYGGTSMEKFTPLETAEWLLSWIERQN